MRAVVASRKCQLGIGKVDVYEYGDYIRALDKWYCSETGLCTLPFVTAEESWNTHRHSDVGQAGKEAHALAL